MRIIDQDKNETIVLQLPSGEQVTIKVCRIVKDAYDKPYKVRLGITAPRHISIHRSEVQAAIDAGKRRGEA